MGKRPTVDRDIRLKKHWGLPRSRKQVRQKLRYRELGNAERGGLASLLYLKERWRGRGAESTLHSRTKPNDVDSGPEMELEALDAPQEKVEEFERDKDTVAE
jgi:hypothetical protein